MKLLLNKNILRIVFIAFLNLSLTGCYSVNQISQNEYSDQEIEKVITINSDTLTFSKPDNNIIEVTPDSIKYINATGDSLSIQQDQINTLIVKEYDKSKSAGIIVAGIVGGVILLFNIIINSVDLSQ